MVLELLPIGQLCDEAAVSFQPSTEAKINPNINLGLIQNYHIDPDTHDTFDCYPNITAESRIVESTTIKLAFRSKLNLEKALKAALTVDYEFYHVIEQK
ncbi:hypothetical protein QYM36_010647 [Artemia franciscana]|uniref:Uncharacterized protein n=1 Tax=Artemia franciscana TaxID=6661 RepID=A0AA88HS70_ARTSF|nr:hypothetical protein QYM36_010647 [Artemia franciscana]